MANATQNQNAMTATTNSIPKSVRTPADVVEEMIVPGFDVEKEYTFKMRSFRYCNNSNNDQKVLLTVISGIENFYKTQ